MSRSYLTRKIGTKFSTVITMQNMTWTLLHKIQPNRVSSQSERDMTNM